MSRAPKISPAPMNPSTSAVPSPRMPMISRLPNDLKIYTKFMQKYHLRMNLIQFLFIKQCWETIRAPFMQVHSCMNLAQNSYPIGMKIVRHLCTTYNFRMNLPQNSCKPKCKTEENQRRDLRSKGDQRS